MENKKHAVRARDLMRREPTISWLFPINADTKCQVWMSNKDLT